MLSREIVYIKLSGGSSRCQLWNNFQSSDATRLRSLVSQLEASPVPLGYVLEAVDQRVSALVAEAHEVVGVLMKC